MADSTRRNFLKTSLVAGAAIPFGLLDERSLLAAASPSLAIAHYKTSPAEFAGIAEEARRLTRSAIEALGGMGRFVAHGNVVWVKPNIGWNRRPEQAATTNPHVVATLVEMCYQAGAGKVVVSDNPCDDARNTFARSGIQEAAEKAGAQVFFLDERKFRRMAIHGEVLKEWAIYQDVVEADRLINVPVVKTHNLSDVTLGLKNLMGVAGGARNRFHQDIDNSLADLAAFLRPRLTVLDGIRVLTANGPTGGNLADVKRKDTIVTGVDQVAVDAVGATLLGYKPEDIGHIARAHARGLGIMNFNSLSPQRLEV